MFGGDDKKSTLWPSFCRLMRLQYQNHLYLYPVSCDVLTGARWPPEFISAQAPNVFKHVCLSPLSTVLAFVLSPSRSLLNSPFSLWWCSDALVFHCSLFSPPLYRIALSERGGCVWVWSVFTAQANLESATPCRCTEELGPETAVCCSRLRLQVRGQT